MTAWMDRHLVNYHQTPEIRRAKYRVCRELGKPRGWAISMRDWRWPKIARFFGFDTAAGLLAAHGLELATFAADYPPEIPDAPIASGVLPGYRKNRI